MTEQPRSPNSVIMDHSRLLRDQKGRFMFIGDSANLSFLREIRVVISDSQGSCSFVDDPLQSCMVEAIPDDNAKSFDPTSCETPPNISFSDACELVEQFFTCTSGLIDLFDEPSIMDELPGVFSTGPGNYLSRAIVYLVMAIGAQNLAQDTQSWAEVLFSRGRYLTAQYLTDDVSVQTAQLYLLTAVYLLGACRRNAAFICLGHAVRSAYALGVHQKSVSLLFPKTGQRERERLWNGIRAIDLFSSASLGRPSFTAETRQVGDSNDEYISNELYAILETVLNDVYGQRRVTSDLLTKIGARLRQWAAAFTNKRGSLNQRIGLDLGEMHLRQTYYWTIMLLTRPFLVDRVAAHAQTVSATPGGPVQPCAATNPSRTLVHACVDSAIKTIALLEPLVGRDSVPKHLPVLINAAFHAALVVGLSYFGDLYQIFPLEGALETAHKILQKFPHDLVALRNSSIITYLQESCAAYLQKRRSGDLAVENDAICQLFGQIHEPSKANSNARGRSRNGHSRTVTPPREENQMWESATEGVSNGAESLLSPAGLSTQDASFTGGNLAAENDLISLLSGDSDLDLEFPMTNQLAWIGSGNDFASLFAMVDMEDPNLVSSRQ